MAWIDRLDETGAAFRATGRGSAPPIAARLACAAALSIVALMALTGHPLLSIWSALTLLAWLFMAGAAKVSSD